MKLIFPVLLSFLCHITIWASITEADFGLFMANEEKSHTFQWENRSSTDLILGKIRSSCGCAAITLSSQLVKSGETVEIRVKLQPNSLSGPFHKIFYIETSDVKQRFLKFSLKGNAQPLLEITPTPNYYIGVLEAGKTYEYTFRIAYKAPVVLELLPGNNPDLKECRLLKNEDGQLLKVAVSAATPGSAVDIKLLLKIRSPDDWPAIEFQLIGRTQGNTAEPQVPEKTDP